MKLGTYKIDLGNGEGVRITTEKATIGVEPQVIDEDHGVRVVWPNNSWEFYPWAAVRSIEFAGDPEATDLAF